MRMKPCLGTPQAGRGSAPLHGAAEMWPGRRIGSPSERAGPKSAAVRDAAGLGLAASIILGARARTHPWRPRGNSQSGLRHDLVAAVAQAPSNDQGAHSRAATSRASRHTHGSFRCHRERNLSGAQRASCRCLRALPEDQKLPLAHQRTALPRLPSAAR
jgi:hypothetical protein